MIVRCTFNRSKSAIWGRSALLACGCAAALLACSTKNSGREPLPDWSNGYEQDASPNGTQDGGTSVGQTDGGSIPPRDFPDDSFGIAIPNNVTWPIRIRQLNTQDQRCAIKQGSAAADITCIIETDELDLYVNGLLYNIIAPKGMCDFVEYWSYMFQNFPIGEGPKEVSWTAHQGGNTSDNINAADGKPRCEFDYSWQYPASAKAPNCCFGTYTKRVTDATTGKVGVSEGNWDGKLADCYHGAAYIDKAAVFTPDGWPMTIIFYIDRSAFVHTVEYGGLSDKYGENVLLANFYDPAGHDGDMPAAFKGEHARPYYGFTCLDDAEEVIGRVRLVVQEWNEEAQFDTSGNPNTEGLEPGWNTPINDIPDWANLTPGNSEYPKILPTGSLH